jgi:hypothetical protein
VNAADPGKGASSADRLLLPRLLAAGSIVLATATFRTCTRSLRLCGERSVPLIRLTADYMSGSASAPTSRQLLRDEVLGLARDLAGVSWHESRRAIDELDLRTRSGSRTSQQLARPYRVKP